MDSPRGVAFGWSKARRGVRENATQGNATQRGDNGLR